MGKKATLLLQKQLKQKKIEREFAFQNKINHPD